MNIRFYVVGYGKDCYGHNSGKVYHFDNLLEAFDFTDSCNEGSDGILYKVVTYEEAIEYLNEFNKTI